MQVARWERHYLRPALYHGPVVVSTPPAWVVSFCSNDTVNEVTSCVTRATGLQNRIVFMAEVPEVETLVRDLCALVVGRTIVGARVLIPAAVRFPEPAAFEQVLAATSRWE
jgi:hypothetical protein